MKELPKISVIIPVYNMENYLNKCVESILNQTYENFEIILVDDGSTDNSPIICDTYNSHYNNVITKHQANLGVSMARNLGVSLANGEYIAFVDADDYATSSYLQDLMMPIINDNDIDICIGNSHQQMLDGQITDYCLESKEEGYIEKENAYQQMLACKQWTWDLWGRIYNKRLFDEYRFPLDISNGEDLDCNWQLLKLANKIYYTTARNYFYLNRSDSVSHKFTIERAISYLRILFKIYDDIKRCVPGVNYRECNRILYSRIYAAYKYLLQGSELVEKDTEFNEIIYFLKTNKEYINKSVRQVLSDVNKIDFAKLTIDEVLLESEKQSCYIFGAGKEAKYMAKFFSRIGYNFDAFIISDRQKIGLSPDDKHRVIHLCDVPLKLYKTTKIFICTGIEYLNEIIQSLLDKGIRNIYVG